MRVGLGVRLTSTLLAFSGVCVWSQGGLVADVDPSDRLCFGVVGSPGDAAIVNLTPVLAQGAGNGQLISSDVTTPPVGSNVNYGPGTVDPNVAVAKIGADGKVCYSNSVHTSVHLVADHLGTIAASAYTPAVASGSPDRKVDTRTAVPYFWEPACVDGDNQIRVISNGVGGNLVVNIAVSQQSLTGSSFSMPPAPRGYEFLVDPPIVEGFLFSGDGLIKAHFVISKACTQLDPLTLTGCDGTDVLSTEFRYRLVAMGGVTTPDIVVKGGTPPYSYQARGLDPGFTLHVDGLLAHEDGIPGTYEFDVTVTDSKGVAMTRPATVQYQPGALPSTC